MGIVSETGDDSSHIVSPAIADDNDVLESYLSALPDYYSNESKLQQATQTGAI
jgi:hypothetical protein